MNIIGKDMPELPGDDEIIELMGWVTAVSRASVCISRELDAYTDMELAAALGGVVDASDEFSMEGFIVRAVIDRLCGVSWDEGIEWPEGFTKDVLEKLRNMLDDLMKSV